MTYITRQYLSKSIFKYIKNKLFYIRTKNRKVKILWYPIIVSKEDFARELSRAVWYMHPVRDKIKVITFIVDEIFSQTMLENFNFPTYIDPKISNLLPEILTLIQFISLDKTEKDLLADYDIVIEWKKTFKKVILSPYLIEADIEKNQFEASRIAQVCNLINHTQYKSIVKKNSKKFSSIIDRFKKYKYEGALLIGSGPSLAELNKKEINTARTLVIVCNSVVKNDEIFEQFVPKIIVASDAVFHSGYSKYAAEFRNMVLKRLMDDPHIVLIVPIRDYLIYTNYFSEELKDRIIGIPVIKSKYFNFDVSKKFFFKSTSNILTLMMIPLASTLSQKISLIGFDGRNKKDIDVFWQYDRNSQFQNEYNFTKYAHPAFYKVNYEQYYQKHCMETQQLIDEISYKNIHINSLTGSNIPALEALYD